MARVRDGGWGNPTQALVALLDCNGITLRIQRIFLHRLLSEARQDCHWSAGKKLLSPAVRARESRLGADALEA